MKPIDAVIIEDEIPSARMLHQMVTSLRPDWQVQVLSDSVDECVEWFATHEHPGLVFLDIHLTDGNAFDLLELAHPRSTIIFTTAYDQYAIRAFTVNSIDYILKPIEENRLHDAIVKYESLHAYTQPKHYLEELIETLRQPEKKRYRNRFLISGPDEFWSLPVEDVAYFYSEDKMTYAVTSGSKEHIIDLSLNKLEEQLDPVSFFRINRQMILNIDAVNRAIPYFKGKIKILVYPPFKSEVVVSESRATAFKQWMNY